jgi:small subunit ribosomal protein S17
MPETPVVNTVVKKKIGNKNEKVGQVVSAKMTKTIVVEVTRRVPHPMYKRIINKRSKFYAHDEEQRAKIGDTVRIIECRPMSKLKRWRLGEVLRKAVQVAVEPSAVDLETTQPTSGSKSLRGKTTAPRGKASAPKSKKSGGRKS